MILNAKIKVLLWIFGDFWLDTQFESELRRNR